MPWIWQGRRVRLHLTGGLGCPHVLRAPPHSRPFLPNFLSLSPPVSISQPTAQICSCPPHPQPFTPPLVLHCPPTARCPPRAVGRDPCCKCSLPLASGWVFVRGRAPGSSSPSTMVSNPLIPLVKQNPAQRTQRTGPAHLAHLPGSSPWPALSQLGLPGGGGPNPSLMGTPAPCRTWPGDPQRQDAGSGWPAPGPRASLWWAESQQAACPLGLHLGLPAQGSPAPTPGLHQPLPYTACPHLWFPLHHPRPDSCSLPHLNPLLSLVRKALTPGGGGEPLT